MANSAVQISWLLKKPTDLDLHCLQRQGISGFSRTRVKMRQYYHCLSSEKEFTVKGMYLLPREVEPFNRGLICKKANMTPSTKDFSS